MRGDIIYGRKPILEALEANRSFEKILISKGSSFFHDIRQAAGHKRIMIQQVPEEKLNRITRKNHQGVIGYVSFVEYQNWENVLAAVYEQGETPLFVALDGVTDVGNFGAIARSAYCLGAHGLLVPEKGSALINGVAVKASAGAVQKINISKVKYLKKSLQEIQLNGIQLIAATLSKTAKPIQQIDFTLPTCIILGAEDTGVGQHICELADDETFIPMKRDFDSLNVSVSAGIILSESLHQRTL